MPKAEVVPVADIERAIRAIRGQRVMLDEDLARLYGVEVKVRNQSVKRNIARFPADFMFQLTSDEAQAVRSRTVVSMAGKGRGGRRHAPYALTEQGVAMLSSVLRSPRAIEVNIEIMRTFVRLRRLLLANAELARKLAALEKKVNTQFQIVFAVIEELMQPPEKPKKRIGFAPNKSK